MSTEILVSVVWATRPFPLPAFQGFAELAIEALLTSRPRKAILFLYLYTAASEASGHPEALLLQSVHPSTLSILGSQGGPHGPHTQHTILDFERT